MFSRLAWKFGLKQSSSLLRSWSYWGYRWWVDVPHPCLDGAEMCGVPYLWVKHPPTCDSFVIRVRYLAAHLQSSPMWLLMPSSVDQGRRREEHGGTVRAW